MAASFSLSTRDVPVTISGYATDPRRSGYQTLYNYENFYYRALVGNDAWGFYEVLRGFCHYGQTTCYPSINLLMAILGIKERRILTGRSITVKGIRRTYPGLIDILQQHGVLIAQVEGEGPTLRYIFHVNLHPPLLTPAQVTQLPKLLQKKHAELLARCEEAAQELKAKQRPSKVEPPAPEGSGNLPEGSGSLPGRSGKLPHKQHNNITHRTTLAAREKINNNSDGTSTTSDVVVALSTPKIATEMTIQPSAALASTDNKTSATTTHLGQASGTSASARASASPPSVLIDPTVQLASVSSVESSAHGKVPIDPPAPTETVSKSNATAALIAIGLAETVVNRLVTRYSGERIAEKLEFLAYLQEYTPEKVKNPRGWLRRAIEENYGSPDGFVSPAVRAAEEAQHQRQAAARQQRATEQHQHERAEQERQKQAEASRLAWLQATYGTTQAEIDLWQQLLAEFKLGLPTATFTAYVANTILLSLRDGKAQIGLPDAHARDWVENRFSKKIERALASYLGGQKITVAFVDLRVEEFVPGVDHGE